jgi:hypothetical protein
MRHPRRHIQRSIAELLSSHLNETLSITNASVKENLGQSEFSRKAPDAKPSTPLCIVTVGGRFRSEDAELGGVNRQSWYDLFIDVIATPPSLTTAISDDIVDLLDTGDFQIYDYSKSPAAKDSWIFVDAISSDYNDPLRRDWITIQAVLTWDYRRST